MSVPKPIDMPRRRHTLIRRVSFAIGLIAAAVALRKPLFQGNFGVVDPGRVYRSAQPSGSLAGLIRRKGIASVVNLRGGSDSDPFYRGELETATQFGVDFYDLPMSATHRPSRRDLLRALAVLDRCRYPILVHCKWGSDRTGLFCALYRLDKLGEPPSRAVEAFTVAHGHVPIFGPERLHEPFDEYARWLAERSLPHDSARFRSWLERDYRSDDPFTGYPAVRPGPRVRDEVAKDP